MAKMLYRAFWVPLAWMTQVLPPVASVRAQLNQRLERADRPGAQPQRTGVDEAGLRQLARNNFGRQRHRRPTLAKVRRVQEVVTALRPAHPTLIKRDLGQADPGDPSVAPIRRQCDARPGPADTAIAADIQPLWPVTVRVLGSVGVHQQGPGHAVPAGAARPGLETTRPGPGGRDGQAQIGGFGVGQALRGAPQRAIRRDLGDADGDRAPGRASVAADGRNLLVGQPGRPAADD